MQTIKKQGSTCFKYQNGRKWVISAQQKFIETQVIDINPDQLYIWKEDSSSA